MEQARSSVRHPLGVVRDGEREGTDDEAADRAADTALVDAGLRAVPVRSARAGHGRDTSSLQLQRS